MASRLVGAATGQGTEGRQPPAPFRSSPRCPVAVVVGPVPGLQPASPGSILPLPSKSVWPLCLAPPLSSVLSTQPDPPSQPPQGPLRAHGRPAPSLGLPGALGHSPVFKIQFSGFTRIRQIHEDIPEEENEIQP